MAVAPKIGDRDEILHKKLHISYIDQFTLPRIFGHLIGAKVVEIRKRGESVLENIFYRANNKFLPCKYPTPKLNWLQILGFYSQILNCRGILEKFGGVW